MNPIGFPDRVGIVDERGAVTFSEVHRRTNALASELRRAGLAAMVPGVLVDQSSLPSLSMAKVFLPRNESSSLLPMKRLPVAASTIFVAPIIEGGDHPRTAVRGAGATLMNGCPRVLDVQVDRIGDDVRIRGRVPQAWRRRAGFRTE